jgi:tRNA G10  N-methylase Trm11
MDFDASWFIYNSAKFTYNEKENLYYNSVDRSLEVLPDKRLVYKYTDYDTQQEIEEEWFLIAVKYHYAHDSDYDIIVTIN